MKIDTTVLGLIDRLCGIDHDAQLVEMFEAGCLYAENSSKNTAITTTPDYWNWWAEEWQDVEMELVMRAMCMHKDYRDNKAYLNAERNDLHYQRSPRRTVEVNELINAI